MIWKDIEGYEGYYKVSDTGLVKSVRYLKRKKCYRNKILKHTIDRYGYVVYGLRKLGINKTITAHRLVLKAFLPNLENKETVNHKNGIKTDNRVENLEWATMQENRTHAVETGLQDHKGEKHPKSKLTKNDVLAVRFIRERYKLSYKFISKMFGVCHQNISSIINRQTWDHV